MRSRRFLRSDGYLWLVCDASSGERSEVRDVACPMKTVDYVFDSENVSIVEPNSGTILLITISSLLKFCFRSG